MNALPGIQLSWDESTESLDTFLRYAIYRREQGETWVRISRTTDRSRTYYADYTVAPGIIYEYAVTQIVDVAGDEVESDFPTAVQSSVTFGHLFIHDTNAPENYTELAVQAQQMAPVQDIAYLQPFSTQTPSARVGNVQQAVYTASLAGAWDETDDAIAKGQWRALLNLMTRQRTYGAVLCARQTRDVRLFCMLEAPQRSDAPVAFAQTLQLREVDFDEAVD